MPCNVVGILAILKPKRLIRVLLSVYNWNEAGIRRDLKNLFVGGRNTCVRLRQKSERKDNKNITRKKVKERIRREKKEEQIYDKIREERETGW